MSLVAKCLARLAGVASNYRVGFSPVGNCLRHCSWLGLPGTAVTNRKFELCLDETLGPVHVFLWDLVLYLGFPDLGQWIMVWGEISRRRTVCGSLIQVLLMSGAHIDRRTHFPLQFLSGIHPKSSWARTQLLFSVKFLFFHHTKADFVCFRNAQGRTFSFQIFY